MRETDLRGKVQQVRQKYDRLSSFYDQRWPSYIQTSLQRLVRAVRLEGSEKILNIACGTGALEALLVKRYKNLSITGVDISEGMLAVARSKLKMYPQVFFTRADAVTLPFGDETFDLAVCASALHYFEDPLALMKEIKRVVKKGGSVVMMDWSRDYLVCRLRDLAHRIRDPAHRRCYSQKELRHLFEVSNFRVTFEQKFRIGLFWGMMITGATRINES